VVALLAVVAVASVWAAGPTRWGPSRWRIAPPQAPALTPRPQPSASARIVLPESAPSVLQKTLTMIAIVAVCVVLLAIAYLLLRRIRIRRRVRRDAVVGRLDVAEAVGPEPEPVPQAAPVVRGLERALRILDEDRTADDAIVQAWLGLEEASVASGAGRRPAETPSEYAARVISRFDADREAVTVLLGLYQGVRFGERHADAATLQTARESLRRLTASWHEEASRPR